MDAMLKRRMWKVAIAHFVLSLFVFCVLLSFPISRLTTDYVFVVFSDSVDQLFYFLQPVFSFAMEHQTPAFGFWTVLMIVTVPFWSLCFGWICVKLENWLNHFPALGKKVF
jgi:hypothetical protein